MSDIIDELVELYAGPEANRLYDEAITELAHALQAAADSTAAGDPPELIAASLLHDVGHLLIHDNRTLAEELTHNHGHDRAGGTFLRRHFSAAVADPVRLHVEAKRYLCAIEPGYFDTLSPSSVRSLELQGGPMSDDERAAFEAEPHFEAAVMLRRYDEAAKVAGREVPPFEHYVPMLRGLLHA
jgi:gamma-butyrobetaine dioxygenase